MKKCTIKFSILLAITIGLINSACSNDEWDKHYNNTDVVLIKESLSDVIKNDGDLTIFNRLLEISGYDSILSSTQTFTVWAPIDSDSAWNADFGAYRNESRVVTADEKVLIKKAVGNHISRFSYPTSVLDSQRLFMLCNKIADFKMINNVPYFAKVALGLESNIPARNGLLHKISGYNPYIPSHWEYLMEYKEAVNMDSLKAYFNSLITEDEYGGQVNNLFKDFAKLDDDDSTYTVIALTNAGWTKALNSALSYHKVFGDTKGLQYQYSKKAIINNLFFNKIADPEGLDSIRSTGKLYFNVNNLIAGATKKKLSNGCMFITDSLRMKPIESWHRKIVVEAETNIYGRTNTLSDLFSKSYYGRELSISDRKYAFLRFIGTQNNQFASLTLKIPNVLSAKYNLYVVTVPQGIDNPEVLKRVKFKVKVCYMAANGTVFPASRPNYDSDKITATKNGFIGSATEVEKIFITQLSFPWSSMFEKGNLNSLNVSVIVENLAKKADDTSTTNPFTRDLRIDCVILEPVE